MAKFNLQEIFERTFDKVNLPSKGVFYDNGQKSFNIRYLSGIEEKVLTSYFLTESGEALELVLNNVIMDDFNVQDLLLSDLQGIMIFLYATAYGDKVTYNSKCPHCNYNDEILVTLSQIDFKVCESSPQNGAWSFFMPIRKHYYQGNTPNVIELPNGREMIEFKLIPIKFGIELNLKKQGKSIEGISKIINKIQSIGGIDNREYIEKVVKKMSLQDFKSLKTFSEKNDLSLQDKVITSCVSCGHEYFFRFNLGYDFLKLPEKHRENIMEECFLISHYSQSGLSFDKAMKLPISERRWYLQRVSEELIKKQEAEKKAMDSAKSKNRK